MPQIIFTDHQGKDRAVEAATGSSVMETAIRNDVPGIVAECGGACACATCHVYVDVAFVDKLDPPSQTERDMLEFAEDARPNSRLSCQLKVTDAIDGLRVTTPESQY